MKKAFASLAVVVGLTASAFAQGTIGFNNASGGGLVYMPDGVTPADVFSVSLWGGASADSLTFIATTDGLGAGYFYVTDDVIIPGVAVGTTAFLQLVVSAPGNPALTGSASWSQLTGGNGAPAAPGVALSNPDITLVPVPEPTSMALIGLGAAAMFIARRRHS